MNMQEMLSEALEKEFKNLQNEDVNFEHYCLEESLDNLHDQLTIQGYKFSHSIISEGELIRDEKWRHLENVLVEMRINGEVFFATINQSSYQGYSHLIYEPAVLVSLEKR